MMMLRPEIKHDGKSVILHLVIPKSMSMSRLVWLR
jgi:hypothetical protein